MSLRAFLHGSRPNPSPRWRVERRHPEGGRWHLVTRVEHLESAYDELLDHGGRGTVGELLRVVEHSARRESPEEASRLLHVATPQGPVAAGPVDEQLDPDVPLSWESAWEGGELSPWRPFGVAEASGVDRRRLALALADSVALLFGPYDPFPDPARETRPQAARDAVRAWGEGTATEADLRVALDALRAFRRGVNGLAWSTDNDGLDLALRFALGENAELAYRTCLWSQAPEVSSHEHAKALRRHVPLSVLLLARAGVPTPLSLGF